MRINSTPNGRGIEEAIELFDVGVRLYAERLRRDDPTASDETINEQVRAWLRSDESGKDFRVSPLEPSAQ